MIANRIVSVNISGAAFSCAFAALALADYVHTGMWISVLFIAMHLQGAVLFLVRADPKKQAASWVAPAVAFLSFCWPYLYLRADKDWSHPGSVLIWSGATGCFVSTFYLGRCFAIVPAYRGVRTGGPYRIVRHPIYACYLIMDLGTVLSSWSTWNLFVAVSGAGLLLARIHYEEQVLSLSPGYEAYRRKVRYKLIPGIY